MAVVTYSLTVVQLSPDTAYLEGELVFVEGVRLVFFEFWRRQGNRIEREKYRFHCMDVDNQLIFRYDNAPHHPTIRSFPHHKHLPTGIFDCTPPAFENILAETQAFVLGIL